MYSYEQCARRTSSVQHPQAAQAPSIRLMDNTRPAFILEIRHTKLQLIFALNAMTIVDERVEFTVVTEW